MPVQPMSRPTVLLSCACLALCAVLQGCASAPERHASPPKAAIAPPPVPVGSEIAMRALSLLGVPYKWGGAGPKTFDCSGLVQYVHEQIGIIAPRTAAQQYIAAKPVALSGLAPGDLLFFAIKGSRISHVAIYAGEGRFVHAPQTGRPVELRMLDDEFYRPRLVGAGRLF
jgi:cell wall-associated NlpC family hydrolase